VKPAVKILIALAFILTAIWLAIFPSGNEFLDWFGAVKIPDLLSKSGVLGPLAIVTLMAAAIVASPLPSAPIALAAGAAYGHYLGMIYVAVGSEIGAVVAFLLARYLGREVVSKWLGEWYEFGPLASQRSLTLLVFASRLLPFISFDAMSYAAGLTNLHLWRFLLATFAGILPMSFVLAHFGAAAASSSFGFAEWIALALGVLTAIPILLISIRHRV